MSWRNLLTPQIERYFAPQENSFSSVVPPSNITPQKGSTSIYESKKPKATYEEVEPDQELSQENSPVIEAVHKDKDPLSSGSDLKKKNQYYFSKKAQVSKNKKSAAHQSLAFDSSSISTSSRYQEKLQGIKKEMSFLKEQLNKYPGTRRSGQVNSSQNLKSQTLGVAEIKKALEVSKRSPHNEIMIHDNNSSGKFNKRRKKFDCDGVEKAEEIRKEASVRQTKELFFGNKSSKPLSSDLSSFIIKSGNKDSEFLGKSPNNLTPLQPLLSSEKSHKKHMDEHFGQNLDKIFLSMEEATTIQKNKRSRSKNPSWLSIHDIHDYEIVEREVTKEHAKQKNEGSDSGSESELVNQYSKKMSNDPELGPKVKDFLSKLCEQIMKEKSMRKKMKNQVICSNQEVSTLREHLGTCEREVQNLKDIVLQSQSYINKLAVQLQSEKKRTEKMQSQISQVSTPGAHLNNQKKDLSLNFHDLRRYDDENTDTSNITIAATTRNSSRNSYRQLNYSQAKQREFVGPRGGTLRNPSPNFSENESRPPTRNSSNKPYSECGKERLPTFEHSDNSLFLEGPDSRVKENTVADVLRQKEKEIVELKKGKDELLGALERIIAVFVSEKSKRIENETEKSIENKLLEYRRAKEALRNFRDPRLDPQNRGFREAFSHELNKSIGKTCGQGIATHEEGLSSCPLSEFKSSNSKYYGKNNMSENLIYSPSNSELVSFYDNLNDSKNVKRNIQIGFDSTSKQLIYSEGGSVGAFAKEGRDRKINIVDNFQEF